MGTIDDEFKWTDENTVIRAVDAVAVYTNMNEELVIRQSSRFGEDDVIIVVPKQYAEGLVLAIKNEIDA